MKRVMMFAAVLIVLGSSVANAASGTVTGKVAGVLVTGSDQFGGCMVKLSENMSTSGAACSYNWASFSCDGTFTTKDVAYRMLDMAQMAKVLNKTVRLTVDDTKKHNNFCFANRIDVY